MAELLRLCLTGTPGQIFDGLGKVFANPERIPLRAQQNTVLNGHQILFYQAAALGILARQYSQPGARILEVGTAMGFSATVLAQAAREALVVTLNPSRGEYQKALPYLRVSRNVQSLCLSSAEYWYEAADKPWDLVFVDGSHKLEDVLLDLRWFDRLKEGGLMVFHDYSPLGAGVPAPGAWEAIERLHGKLNREPDVLLVDDRLIGFVGWYRQPGERWQG